MNHNDELEEMGACPAARKWAKRYKTAQKAWDACDDPNWLCWYLDRTLPKIERQILAGKLVIETPLGDGRTVWDIMPESGRECLRVLRSYLDGEGTQEELDTAARAATLALAGAAWAAAGAVAWAVAWAAGDAWAAWAARAARAAMAARAARAWQCATIRQRYPDIEAVRAKAEGRDR